MSAGARASETASQVVFTFVPGMSVFRAPGSPADCESSVGFASPGRPGFAFVERRNFLVCREEKHSLCHSIS